MLVDQKQALPPSLQACFAISIHYKFVFSLELSFFVSNWRGLSFQSTLLAKYRQPHYENNFPYSS